MNPLLLLYKEGKIELMIRIICLTGIFCILSGCTVLVDPPPSPSVINIDLSTDSQSESPVKPAIDIDNTQKYLNEKESPNPLDSYPYLDEKLKEKIAELQNLWKKFESSKRDDMNPTNDFHNSEYLSKLKELLSERDSINISISDLSYILWQNALVSFSETVSLDNNEYNIRVIAYTADFYTKVLTDICDVKNKWIFIQCWNDNEFYFSTLSDGNIHTAKGFIPIIDKGKLNIILSGYSCPGYPMPPFIWSWRLEDDGFQPCKLFEQDKNDMKKYEIVRTIDYYNSKQKKWTLHTDGSYTFVEKRSSAPESELWTTDYEALSVEADNEKEAFIFTGIDWDGSEDSRLFVQFKDGHLIIY